MGSIETVWHVAGRKTRVSVVTTILTVFCTPLAVAGSLPDFDARVGSVEPSSQQLGMVAALGAEAEWSELGTPKSLIRYGDYLATGLNGPDAATVARNWVDANKALFRLASIDSLTTVSDAAFPWTEAYAVTFRQEIGGLLTAEDGVLTVGIVGNATDGWKIAYVSATTTGDAALSGGVTMTAADAYVRAAGDIGAGVQVSDIVTTKADGDWTTFSIDGFEDVQRARMRALPTPNNGLRPVYETIYLENSMSAAPRAYLHYIDAESGKVWMRKDIVEHSHPVFEAFAGTLPDNPAGDGECADSPTWTVDPGETVGTVSATATADLPLNDATIAIYRDGVNVAEFDSGFSPEAVSYSPGDGGEGDYFVRVCDFVDGADWTVTRGYTGTVTFLEQDANAEGIPLPEWRVFPANPNFFDDPTPSADIRDLWCWDAGSIFTPGNPPNPACDLEVGNIWSRAPWDYDLKTNAPTFTTRGNYAFSSLSESPLTPGVPYQPVAVDRSYGAADWHNTWFENKCNIGLSQADGDGTLGPDADEAVVNLFAMHNRMHAWSYALGFTEVRWNAQSSNFGNTATSAENDPVIGNAQAGGLAGGFPSYLGRDNANMITLPDGVSSITNMYLWQPIAGAFYAPCVDGDYDMAIIGHEYGHMTENRMIGKGGTRGGHHAGAMGESFGDFSGAEYLNGYGFVPVNNENRFSVGGYATGNGERAIRNFNMSYPRTGAFPEPGSSTTGSGFADNVKVNPLNFSNMGYDLTGPQVHADGEIWSATNFTIREYLVNKHNADYLESDAALQEECADGDRNPANCPGNRRWIQIVFDAMLLMPTSPSMLQARDAYLAADLMRFGGENHAEIWLAFAHRGFGDLADSKGNGTADPVPDFSSPLADNATITFEVLDQGGVAIPADIYVGHYEARVSPIADTRPGMAVESNRDEVAPFAPGEYEFVVRADGHGHFRFRKMFDANDVKTITITLPANLASSANGATASGDGAAHGALIDDTEATNWGKAPDNVAIDVGQPAVTVDLAGGIHTVNRVQVSAMLLSQNRFTALREFKVQTSTDGVTFSDWITSGADAFPGHIPRPVSPEMILRSFDGPAVNASHVRIVALNNQCTGNPLFQDDGDATTPDHDNDPLNTTDCRVGVGAAAVGNTIPILGGDEVLAARHDEVYIAELQVFGAKGSTACTSGCGVNQAPIANDDSDSANAGQSVTVDVLANDSDDAPKSELTVEVVSQGASGTATVNADGSITYTHGGDAATSDSFTYKLTDAGGLMSGVATVSITINQDGNGGSCPHDGDDGSDDDDFDDDCIRDDDDSDDDNDGINDDDDIDDDNDGINDDDDSDDDNDGIDDDFDQRSTHESQSVQSGSAAAGADDDYAINVEPNTLLLIALVETAVDQSVRVDIIDPNGFRLASSPSVDGRSLATAVPTTSGSYIIRVSNTSGEAIDYQLTTISRSSW